MISCYIAVIPETIKSIVTTGKYPANLPHYVLVAIGGEVDNFDCKSTCSDAVLMIQGKPFDQIFILELSIPNNQSFRLKVINSAWINSIYVYSKLAEKLVNKLFEGVCPKPISLRPELYPPLEGLRTREARVPFPIAENVASSRSSHTVGSAINSDPKPVTYQYPFYPTPKNDFAIVERLDSFDKHRDFLQRAFLDAQRSILITIYGAYFEALSALNLDQLIKDAVGRKIRLYIYNHSEGKIDERAGKFFSELGINIQNFNTYSQILAVDNDVVGVGSFNWFSSIYEQNDATLVYRGDAGKCLHEYVWDYIPGYRNVWENRYHELPSNSEILDQDDSKYNNPNLGFLSTRESHYDFITQAFLIAKERIIIFSPLISDRYIENFSVEKILQTVRRGVKVYFFSLPEQIHKTKFDRFISEKINHPNVHLVSREDINNKTFIVDNCILEGPFNWLSTWENPRSREITLICRDSIAERFIKKFECSELGKALLEGTVLRELKRKHV